MYKRSITLEFYIDEEKELCVEYNTTKYKFSDFWNNVEDARDICQKVYFAFKKQYPEHFDKARENSKGWEEAFLKIVNNHLRTYDKKIDVFIRSNGDIVFNLEHP